MRKLNAVRVCETFIKAINQLDLAFVAVQKAQNLSFSTKKIMAEMALMSAVVRWEGFISDLFVAYLNIDSTRYQSLEWGSLSVKHRMLFSIQKRLHPQAAAIRKALDTEGRNVTFKTPDEMIDKAKQWLVSKHFPYDLQS